jgi:serine/threonine-protein kinase
MDRYDGRVGDVLLGGKYRVGERLGAGGTAEVHAGVNRLTERDVAIKRLFKDRATDATVLGRFEREARAAGRVRSPYVVDVLDVGVDEEGLPFLVMERLRGETLLDRMRRDGALAPEIALGILHQVLLGVADAHRAGVIHRDLKPANIYLSGAARIPNVKIVDFGVSKIVEPDARELTRTGEAIGTIHYMAPEQIRGSGRAAPATDLWAAGIVLHRMLTGRNPFKADDSVALLARVLEEPHEPLAAAELAPEVVDAVQPIIDRALAKSLTDRYASAVDMAKEIAAAGRRLGFSVASDLSTEDVSAACDSDSAPAAARSRHSAPSRAGARWPWVLSGLLAGCVSGFFVPVARAPRPVATRPPEVVPEGATAFRVGDDPPRWRIAAEGFEAREVVTTLPASIVKLASAPAPRVSTASPSPSPIVGESPPPVAAPKSGRPLVVRGRKKAGAPPSRAELAPFPAEDPSPPSTSGAPPKPIEKPPY